SSLRFFNELRKGKQRAQSFGLNRQRAAEGVARMTSGVPLSIAPRDDQLWPTLTPSQIARVAKHGSLRSLQPGDVVLEAGQQGYPFFVVTNGELVVVRASCDGEQLITMYHPGSFSGELNMLAG